jgi:spore coat polysaccharide biosynthesis protein SpsF
MILRKLTEKDCDLLFDWANDNYVRKNSFNSNKITYEDHIKWFQKKLELDNCIIYIGEENNNTIGQIRLDINNNTGIINYSIDKHYRGEGYGTKMLQELERTLERENLVEINKLIGKVKHNNIPSQRVFEKCKYKVMDSEEYLIYSKEI